MEKAILKTLIYADIFDYPMKAYEIHKWLIGRKASLRQAEKALGKLVQSGKCRLQSGYYFLPRRVGFVVKRRRKEEQSGRYFRKAKMLVWILKLIPWIKLVGVSGGLAMENASKKDDIDLFIITGRNRIWISRFLALILLSLTGQRRKVGEKGRKIAGKLCLNILLEDSSLEQQSKDMYVAHEVLQMRVLWQRDGVYSRYLSDNDWVFKFLPNWTTTMSSPRRRGSNSELKIVNWIPAFAGMTLEAISKWFQLKIMKKPEGMERIEDGALYFHPNDIREEILVRFKKNVM